MGKVILKILCIIWTFALSLDGPPADRDCHHFEGECGTCLGHGRCIFLVRSDGKGTACLSPKAPYPWKAWLVLGPGDDCPPFLMPTVKPPPPANNNDNTTGPAISYAFGTTAVLLLIGFMAWHFRVQILAFFHRLRPVIAAPPPPSPEPAVIGFLNPNYDPVFGHIFELPPEAVIPPPAPAQIAAPAPAVPAPLAPAPAVPAPLAPAPLATPVPPPPVPPRRSASAAGTSAPRHGVPPGAIVTRSGRISVPPRRFGFSEAPSRIPRPKK